MYIDTSKITTHTINLFDIKEPFDIVRYCKKHDIKSLVYAFIHKGNVMKFGVQYDVVAQEPGERPYRQAFHIPGWAKQASKNSAGNDMLDIVSEIPGINRIDISIKIWDMTNYPRASSFNPKFEVNCLERQLIKEHIETQGNKPIGNIKDESHMDKKSIVTDRHFESLFDYA